MPLMATDEENRLLIAGEFSVETCVGPNINQSLHSRLLLFICRQAYEVIDAVVRESRKNRFKSHCYIVIDRCFESLTCG